MRRPWHHYLVALYPLAFLWAWNIREVDVAEVALPALILVLATAMLQAVGRRFIPVPDANAATISAFWALVFSFGPLRAHIVFPGGDAGMLMATAGIFLGFALMARRVRTPLPGFTSILNVVFLALVAASAIEVAIHLPARLAVLKPALAPPGAPRLTATPAGRPDIYYIILDGYGRSDILEDRFGHDNGPFLGALEARGFRVIEKSRTNYFITSVSLATALNMDHAADLGVTEPVLSEIRLMRNSRIEEMLKGIGYTTIAVSSGRMHAELGGLDRLIRPAGLLTPYQIFLLHMTPLTIPFESRGWLYHRHALQILEGLDHLVTAAEQHPAFVLGHIYAPHPPFVFDRNGGFVYPRRPLTYFDASHYIENGGTRDEYLRGYVEQLRFLNVRLIEVIDRILARPGPRPIIILQGDHGPGSGLDWDSPERSDIAERAGIFNAWLAPEPLRSALPDTLTPVNTFPYLCNALFDARIALRSDSTYYSSWNTSLHDFVDVTDRCGENVPATSKTD